MSEAIIDLRGLLLHEFGTTDPALLKTVIKERREYRPIDTAPKDGRRLVLWCEWQDMRGEMQRSATTGYWTDHNGGGWVKGTMGTPTHWAPLPDEPKRA